MRLLLVGEVEDQLAMLRSSCFVLGCLVRTLLATLHVIVSDLSMSFSSDLMT
jgi:hypothetical protein